MSPAVEITSLVLEEFRLHAADTIGLAADIVATFSGIEPAVPLLTSIDDPRDVATIRARHAGEGRHASERNALDGLVASWRPRKHYTPRIAERSQSPALYYRLAVTESGINDAEPDPHAAMSRNLNETATTSPLRLLWIGSPRGTFAGLLILLGNADDRHTRRPDPRDWPLPLSRYLGVRIYESRA